MNSYYIRSRRPNIPVMQNTFTGSLIARKQVNYHHATEGVNLICFNFADYTLHCYSSNFY